MDEQEEKLLEKCKEMADDPNVMAACRVMLDTLEKKKIKASEEPLEQTYVEMAENIAPEDVPLVLKMALKVAKSGDIKDPEAKDAAERLIRYLG